MKKDDNPIKVSLFGAGGKMGAEVAFVLQYETGFELTNLIERPEHPAVGTELCGGRISDNPFDLQLEGTVFCDFTNSKTAVKNTALAAELKCPILIGATGFNLEESVYLESLGEKIPIMVAPNLSRGVDLLYRLAEVAADTVGDAFQVEIIEAHHRWKEDSPSGTARELSKVLREHGDYGEIPVHSIRMGDITGEHRLIFAAEGEMVEIIHRAASRRAFAKGVPAALKFLADANPGHYSFKQALES